MVSSVPPALYIELYSGILNRLDPREIYDRLLSFGDCPAMLCWEPQPIVSQARHAAIDTWLRSGSRIASE